MSGRSVFGRLGCGSSPVWRTSSGSAPADVPSPTNERQRGAPPTSSLPKTGVAQRRPSSWHTAQPAKSSSPSQSDAQPAKSDGAAATPRAVSSSMMIQGSDRQTGDVFSQPAASTRDMILLQTKKNYRQKKRREGGRGELEEDEEEDSSHRQANRGDMQAPAQIRPYSYSVLLQLALGRVCHAPRRQLTSSSGLT